MKTLLLPAGLALAATASAQNFNYPDFSGASTLVLNQDALILGNLLRVNSAALSERGSVYHDTRVDVTGGFETTFTFRIPGPFALGGGDGMTFILQDDPQGSAALGNHGGAMGYGGFATSPSEGIDNSLVIEIDTYNNGATWNETSANHISVHTAGTADNTQDEAASIGYAQPVTNLNDGAPHTMRVVYVPGTLEVYLDDLSAPLISVPYDLIGGGTYLNGGAAPGLNLPDGKAWVGFTAGNGGAYENHEVLSWQWGPDSGIGITCDPASPHFLGNSVKLDTSSFGSGVGSDLHVEAVDGPPGEFGFLLMSGDGSIALNVFNGVLCLGSPQGRYNPLAASNQGLPELNSLGQFDASGVLQNLVGTATSTGGSGFDVPLALPLTPAGQVIQPGDTWYFQCWYRDQISTPGDSANFSNVIEVTFP